MELKFDRARFDAGEMPTRTRDGRRVLRVVDSGLDCLYPLAAWVEGAGAASPFSRDGRFFVRDALSPPDLVHEPQKVRVGLRRNPQTVSGFLPTANPDKIDLWREQGVLVAEAEVAIGEGV